MEDKLIAYGNEVKALGDGKIGGVLVRMTTKQDPDLTDDYFDVKSDIRYPETLDVYYNHGLDDTLKKRVIGKAKLSRMENADVWAETQLNMRDEYEKAIYAMAEARKLGYSSGALSHLVEREPAGKAAHIKTWVIGEASLTPTPAEYRNTVVTLKSLLPSDAALSDQDETNKQTIIDKENKMSDEIKSAVEQAVADALKVRDAELKAKADADVAIKAAEDVGYKKAVEELKTRKAPHFNANTVLGFSEEKDAVPAFKHWICTGQENQGLIRPDASYDIKAAYNVTTSGSGGALVPDPLMSQIVAKRSLASWVRQAPVQILQTASDHLLVPKEDTSQTAFTKTAESGTYSNNEGTVAQKDLILYKYTKEVRATEEFLMDNATNFDAWLVQTLARAEAVTENTIFTLGDGSGNPEGVVPGSTAGNTMVTADTITPAEIAELIGKLGAGYNVPSECGFLTNNAAKWYISGLTGTDFAFRPTPSGAANGGDMSWFGYPAYTSDDVVVYTTHSGKILVFGNFNFYAVVEKPGMLVQRNPYLYMASGQIGLFANIYRGGGVLQSEAFYHMVGHPD